MLSIFAQELLGDICMSSGDCFIPKVSKQTSLGLGKCCPFFSKCFLNLMKKGEMLAIFGQKIAEIIPDTRIKCGDPSQNKRVSI